MFFAGVLYAEARHRAAPAIHLRTQTVNQYHTYIYLLYSYSYIFIYILIFCLNGSIIGTTSITPTGRATCCTSNGPRYKGVVLFATCSRIRRKQMSRQVPQQLQWTTLSCIKSFLPSKLLYLHCLN